MLRFTKSSFTQNLGNSRLLAPLLEQYSDYDEPWEFKYEPKVGDDAWHPSGDCMPSCEALYYQATAQTERAPISPSLQRTFIVGHFWHQLLQHVIVKMGLAEPSAIERKEVRAWGDASVSTVRTLPSGELTPWAPYHWVTGSGDVAPLVLPQWEGILDIKTMNGTDFREADKTGLLPFRFADKYECQVQIYMDLFKQDRALILGVNKDSPHGFTEFQFERNQGLIDTIYAKWEYVSDLLNRYVGEDPNSEELDASFPLPLTGPKG